MSYRSAVQRPLTVLEGTT